MKKKLLQKLAVGGMAAVFVILILAGLLGASWIITCGIVKLITMCFGVSFKWSISTGIWLILLLLSWAIKPSKSSKD